MKKPYISCVILCYNYGKYLNKAIESCLSQTIDKSLIEILVLDDGSTDNTPEICEFYKNRIRISRSENMGFSKTLERGLMEANGEYVAYLDADDWWHEDKLKQVFSKLNENVLVVAHNLVNVDINGINMKIVGARGNTSSVCVHRKAALTLMPTTSEIFCDPFFKINKGVLLDEVLGYYRIHESSMTDRSINSQHTIFFANTSLVLANKLIELTENIPFWAMDEHQLRILANHHYCEYFIKTFQRSTEINKGMLKSWYTMIKKLIKLKGVFGKRELRLTIRMALQIMKLKSHKNIYKKGI